MDAVRHLLRKPFLPISVGLLALAVVLLPVFEFDTPYDPRTAVPSACVSAAGVLTAFFAIRRLNSFLRIASCLSLLLNACLFFALM